MFALGKHDERLVSGWVLYSLTTQLLLGYSSSKEYSDARTLQNSLTSVINRPVQYPCLVSNDQPYCCMDAELFALLSSPDSGGGTMDRLSLQLEPQSQSVQLN